MPTAHEHIGKVIDWNDARGFGFIDDAGGGRVFFHIRQFDTGAGRPAIGDDVVFTLGPGRDGRPAAQKVIRLGSSARIVSNERQDAPPRVTVRIVGGLMLVTAIICCVVARRVPIWFPLLYAVAGGVSAAFYVVDKRAAQRRDWRIPESRLHMVDAAFGIVGGLVAQAVLRHKSSKLSFAIVTGIIFTAHMGALLALLAGYTLA